jgi:hypothetical protein
MKTNLTFHLEVAHPDIVLSCSELVFTKSGMFYLGGNVLKLLPILLQD